MKITAVLARPAAKITVNDALKALGGLLFDEEFCSKHGGVLNLCMNSIDCSIRSLWSMVQSTLDNLLDKITLADLSNSENQAAISFQSLIVTNPN